MKINPATFFENAATPQLEVTVDGATGPSGVRIDPKAFFDKQKNVQTQPTGVRTEAPVEPSAPKRINPAEFFGAQQAPTGVAQPTGVTKINPKEFFAQQQQQVPGLIASPTDDTKYEQPSPVPPPPVVNTDKRRANAPVFDSTTGSYSVDEWTLDAIKWKESNFGDPRFLKSKAGAAGPYQIMASTAKQPGFGVTPLKVTNNPKTDERYDEVKARNFARQYMNALVNYFNGDMEAALAGYNWGPGAAERWVKAGKDKSKLPKETRDYIETLAPNPGEVAMQLDQEYVPATVSLMESVQRALESDPITAAAELEIDDTPELSNLFARGFGTQEDYDDLNLASLSAGTGGQSGKPSSGLFGIWEDAKRAVAQNILPALPGAIQGSVKAALDIANRVAYMNNPGVIPATDVTNTELAKETFRRIAPIIYDYADGIEYDRRPDLREMNGIMDYITEPFTDPGSAATRLRVTIGEGAPIIAGAIAVGIMTKGYGVIPFMYAVEAGSADREIAMMQAAGADISDEDRMRYSVAVGAVNASLEKFGFSRVMAVMKAPGIRGKIGKLLLAAPLNGMEETLQGLTMVGAEYGLTDELPPDIWKRMVDDYYAGSVVGFTAAATLGTAINQLEKGQPHAEYLGTEMVNGEAVSKFRVLRTGPMQGQVLTDAEMRANNIPRGSQYVVEHIRQDFMTHVKGATKDAADALVNIWEARARTTGVSLAELFESNADLRTLGRDMASRTMTPQFGFGDYVDAMADIVSRTLSSREMAVLKKEGVDTSNPAIVAQYFMGQMREYISRNLATTDKKASARKDIDVGGSFNYLKDFISEHLLTTISQGKEITPEQYNFLDTVFSGVPEQGMPNVQNKSTYWERFLSMAATKAHFRRQGMQVTGEKIANHYSTIDFAVTQAKDLATRIGERVRKVKGVDEATMKAEAVLLAESRIKMFVLQNKKAAGTITEYENALLDTATLIRDYFAEAKKQLQISGAIKEGHLESAREWTANRLKNVQGLKAQETDPVRIAKLQALENKLMNQLAEMWDVQFAHIPLKAWFESVGPTSSTKSQQVLNFLTAHKRQVVKIQDLIDNGVLDISDINLDTMLASYSQKYGHDLSYAAIRNAAVTEGAAVRLKSPDGRRLRRNNDEPPSGLFRSYDVHWALNDWLHMMARGDSPGILRRAISTVKMLAFFEPALLATYNVIQLGLIGAMSITSPIKSAMAVVDGVKDYVTKTDMYYEAMKLGVTSQSFRNPFYSVVHDIEDAGQGRKGKKTSIPRAIAGFAVGGLATTALTGGAGALLGAATGAAVFYPKVAAYFRSVIPDSSPMKNMMRLTGVPLREAYNAVSRFAWSFDHMTRQIGFRKLLADGLTPKDAAELSSKVFGDYADVSDNLRAAMNVAFFTPTYKVAMFKLYAESIRNIPRALAGTSTDAQTTSAKIMFNLAALVLAVDFFFVYGMGWERDQFGRRYFMRKQTHAGPKDIVAVFAGPHDLLTKYFMRYNEATDVMVDNPALRFVELNKWEITPLFRLAYDVVQNQKGGSSGDQIFADLDSPKIKALKSAEYFLLNAVSAFKKFSDEEFSPQGAEAFVREYGHAKYALSQMFLTIYSRDPKKIQIANALMREVDQLEKNLGLGDILDVFLRGAERDQDKGLSAIFKEIDPRMEQFLIRMDLLKHRLEEEHYGTDEYTPLKNPDLFYTRPTDTASEGFNSVLDFLRMTEEEIEEDLQD